MECMPGPGESINYIYNNVTSAAGELYSGRGNIDGLVISALPGHDQELRSIHYNHHTCDHNVSYTSCNAFMNPVAVPVITSSILCNYDHGIDESIPARSRYDYSQTAVATTTTPAYSATTMLNTVDDHGPPLLNCLSSRISARPKRWMQRSGSYRDHMSSSGNAAEFMVMEEGAAACYHMHDDDDDGHDDTLGQMQISSRPSMEKNQAPPSYHPYQHIAALANPSSGTDKGADGCSASPVGCDGGGEVAGPVVQRRRRRRNNSSSSSSSIGAGGYSTAAAVEGILKGSSAQRQGMAARRRRQRISRKLKILRDLVLAGPLYEPAPFVSTAAVAPATSGIINNAGMLEVDEPVGMQLQQIMAMTTMRRRNLDTASMLEAAIQRIKYLKAQIQSCLISHSHANNIRGMQQQHQHPVHIQCPHGCRTAAAMGIPPMAICNHSYTFDPITSVTQEYTPSHQDQHHHYPRHVPDYNYNGLRHHQVYEEAAAHALNACSRIASHRLQ